MDRSRQRRQLQTFDPSDESLLARVGAATAEDIDTAVKAARAAFDDGPWPNLAGAERAAVLRRIAQGIRGRQRELAELEVRDNGKPLPEALWDIDDTAGCFDFYADLAERLDTNRERQTPWPTSASVPWRAENPSGWPARSSPGTSRC